jgi:hypothetical protein
MILNMPNNFMRKIWRLWAKAIGGKDGITDIESDKVALIRTLIILSYIITNMFIIVGIIHHW